MKRQIRLREFEADKDMFKSPSITYAEKSRNLNSNIAYKFQTDSNGYIISGRRFIPVLKICVVGASLIENKFVRESCRWNTYLEGLFLYQNIPVKVYNAGYSGATSLNVLNTLTNKLLADSFDSIIYFISSNDYSAIAYSDSYWNSTKDHSNLFLTDYESAERNFKNLNKDHFESIVKSIHTTALNFNQEFYFATYPNLSCERVVSTINEMLRSVCMEHSIPLLDIDKEMKARNIDYESNFYDRRHMNEIGSETLSKMLYDFYMSKWDLDTKDHKTVFKKKKVLNNKISLSSESDELNIKSVCSNDFLKTSNINLIFSIDNSNSEKDVSLLVKLYFEEIKSVENISGLSFREDLGWHFLISAPKGKFLENSYHFEVVFKGNMGLVVEKKDSSTKVSIDSIVLEIIESNNS